MQSRGEAVLTGLISQQSRVRIPPLQPNKGIGTAGSGHLTCTEDNSSVGIRVSPPYVSVAQLVEHLVLTQGVEGSSPSGHTKALSGPNRGLFIWYNGNRVQQHYFAKINTIWRPYNGENPLEELGVGGF